MRSIWHSTVAALEKLHPPTIYPPAYTRDYLTSHRLRMVGKTSFATTSKRKASRGIERGHSTHYYPVHHHCHYRCHYRCHRRCRSRRRCLNRCPNRCHSKSKKCFRLWCERQQHTPIFRLGWGPIFAMVEHRNLNCD